jgi:hypothetical protein
VTEPNPAGWFADPFHRFQHRYWDGASWTSHVSTQGTPTTDPWGIEPSPPGVAPIPTYPPPMSLPTAGAARPWSSRVLVIVLVGAGLLAIGAILPWVRAEASFGSSSFSAHKNGLDGDGVLTGLLAVGIVLFLLLGKARLGFAWTVLSLGVLAIGIAVYDIIDVSNEYSDLTSANFHVNVGFGLWLTAAAAGVVIVGGLFALLEARRAPAIPA